MTKNERPSKRTRGRPVKYPMPEPIPDTLENVLRALVRSPPKKRREWEFMKKARNTQTANPPSQGTIGHFAM